MKHELRFINTGYSMLTQNYKRFISYYISDIYKDKRLYQDQLDK